MMDKYTGHCVEGKCEGRMWGKEFRQNNHTIKLNSFP